MKYANIEIGKKEIRVTSSEVRRGRLVHELALPAKLNTIYSQGTLTIDTEGAVNTALDGLAQAGEAAFFSVTGYPNAVVVLGEDNLPITPCLSWRDESLERLDRSSVDTNLLFEESGVVPDSRSALHLLLASREEDPELFSRAKTFMFLTDYVRYRLTGVMATDRSLAEAAGMLRDGEWNTSLFERLGLDNLFPAFAEELSEVGELTEDAQKKCGYNSTARIVSSNAVANAVSALGCGMFLTSHLTGRIGVEVPAPVMTDEARDARAKHITSASGAKYIMVPFAGYEAIGRLKAQMGEGATYDAIEAAARESKRLEYVDIRDSRLASGDVAAAINEILAEQGAPAAEGGDVAGVLYNSIARYITGCATLLEGVSGETRSEIYIIGRAARDTYLNTLVALHTGKTVVASPGFSPSVFAAIRLMAGDGNVELSDTIPLVKSAFGLTTWRRKEE